MTIKNFLSYLWALAVTTGFLFIVVLTTTAYAQDVDTGGRIALAELTSYLIELVFAAALPAVYWVSHRIVKLLKMEEDTKVRGYIETAIRGGLAFGKARAIEASKNLQSPEIKNQIAYDATNYVIKSVPDGLRRLNVNADTVEALVRSRMGVVIPETEQPDTTPVNSTLPPDATPAPGNVEA